MWSAEFKELWPSLKRVKGAPAASACLLEHASEEVFPLIFPSSSLSSALAGLLVLAPPSADAARRLALLALRGAPGSDAAQRVAQAPEALRPLLVQQLLLLSDSLPSEGSPHGEAHGQHLRYWLCLGELLSAGDAFSAASAAQRALRAPLLPATRVLVQNVWAKAAFLAGDAVILPLAELLQDFPTRAHHPQKRTSSCRKPSLSMPSVWPPNCCCTPSEVSPAGTARLCSCKRPRMRSCSCWARWWPGAPATSTAHGSWPRWRSSPPWSAGS
ncbi:unnamed protein product [Effrenium voratum]|uniref:Uncharacterized protein n=1 Tax=Effrenium voratum TaxID=2562239 RepID=A0AA36JMQ2_9DINO|nr:unnamed protein product [Effrenium voratum]